ncbi:CDP-diacylglycerol--serine O-phosphatidyltransferase [Methylophaga sp. OBS1]|uniref:CDP-diacylglycerol--serine O-phosphatidyltransferase n=1 Tax=Methylophaga sp. OBS1 TaxID=2991933 RepID=UPI00224D77C5|nr:CDP-diacylglycerol--serine O-phosphatidyltransferase [Methylophaga sp. OBS1]MCX4191329.1 CDP-diacylglycerol--serine O-phosphatidyltransferase [Methylophaga sp. OBS1]MCX4191725.1 CDP-diacylglycerol--serine O-phosphatidyltransferase [Methylophaga sp. OBS1]
MVSSDKQQRRGIYLLPNLFTTAGLFAGFYAIIAAIRQDFDAAAIAIFVAMIMDGLDGRIARMTNTQSAFGAEYDSLSDMVAFGLAPALVVFLWALLDMGKFGWMIAFIYAACGALRLARFNTQIGTADKRYFQGLPSPAAAACVAGWVWLGTDRGLDPALVSNVAVPITFFAAILMVSSMRYYSFKELDLKNRVPFIKMLALVLIFALIANDPPLILFSAFLVYAVSGPVFTLFKLRQHRSERNTGK